MSNETDVALTSATSFRRADHITILVELTQRRGLPAQENVGPWFVLAIEDHRRLWGHLNFALTGCGVQAQPRCEKSMLAAVPLERRRRRHVNHSLDKLRLRDFCVLKVALAKDRLR